MSNVVDLREHKRKLAAARYQKDLRAARRDSYALAHFAGLKENGDRFAHEPVHSEWHRLWQDNDRSILCAPVGSAKTGQLAWHLLHRFGTEPNVCAVYLSASEKLPKRVCAHLKDEIENNVRLKAAHPDLRREKRRNRRQVWSTTEFLIERSGTHRDPSFQALGLFGKILGSRTDILCIDDILNLLNTLSDLLREKVADWLAEVISRLKPDARVIAIGHLWHKDDAYQKLLKLKELDNTTSMYRYRRYGAIVKDKEGNEKPLVPSIQSIEHIRRKERELGPIHSMLMLWNRLPADTLGRFKTAWFDRCLRRGIGLEFLQAWSGGDGITVTGVDLGHRKDPGSDVTAMVTAAVLPDGSRQVIDVRSGLWSGPEIVRELRDVHTRFDSNIFVENNAAQDYILDFAAELTCVAARPHHTGTNKYDLQNGIEAIGRECDQGKWMLPCVEVSATDEDDSPVTILEAHEEVQKMISGALNYHPKLHPADHLMAWWICREGCRMTAIERAGVDMESYEDLIAHSG